MHLLEFLGGWSPLPFLAGALGKGHSCSGVTNCVEKSKFIVDVDGVGLKVDGAVIKLVDGVEAASELISFKSGLSVT